MKIFDILFISFCLIGFINSTCQPDEENNKIRDEDDCVNRQLSDEEKNTFHTRCCYMRQKVDDNTRKGKEYSCIAITENDYKNVKKLIKQLESESGIKDVKIDCKATYIKYALLSLFLLLF